jgi:hypothetical protein
VEDNLGIDAHFLLLLQGSWPVEGAS